MIKRGKQHHIYLMNNWQKKLHADGSSCVPLLHTPTPLSLSLSNYRMNEPQHTSKKRLFLNSSKGESNNMHFFFKKLIKVICLTLSREDSNLPPKRRDINGWLLTLCSDYFSPYVSHYLNKLARVISISGYMAGSSYFFMCLIVRIIP